MPYGRQAIDDDDIDAVVRVLRSDRLTTGPSVEAFEKALAGKTGAAHAVSCSSGTAALHLAMLALDLEHDDAVIVPTITFLATANAVRFVGAEVIFADVDPDTGLIGANHLEAAIAVARDRGLRPRAVIPVHLAGQTADMIALAAAAQRNDIVIVEDACHALGGGYGGDNGIDHIVGDCSHGVMACFSFHPIKIVCMGEGGAVTTNDPKLAARLSLLRNHGMVHDPAALENHALGIDEGDDKSWYYEMPDLGFNYRASDIHCALGLSQLAKLDQFVERRGSLADRYEKRLANFGAVMRPLKRMSACSPAWHLSIGLIDFSAVGVSRGELMGLLQNQGIGTQVHYIPVHLQPYYRARYGEATLSGAIHYYQRCLSLPLFPAMTEADVDRVCDGLAAALGGMP